MLLPETSLTRWKRYTLIIFIKDINKLIKEFHSKIVPTCFTDMA
jgi:hypothetical protein